MTKLHLLTGSHYVEELLSHKNHQCILDVFRLPLATFLASRLVYRTRLTTSNRRGIECVSERALAIFLKIVGENASNRVAQERFQGSGDTISRAFNKVLDAMVELYTELSSSKTPASSEAPGGAILKSAGRFVRSRSAGGRADPHITET